LLTSFFESERDGRIRLFAEVGRIGAHFGIPRERAPECIWLGKEDSVLLLLEHFTKRRQKLFSNSLNPESGKLSASRYMGPDA